ncbi:MAG: Cache 3/Cache 2 fusion domain-containing protein [Lachnospiraceae bacterium]|nr:Cache 3/Cache 2 fusion domain-containing protein [Lachnospiraceae bacterium]
MKEKENQTNFGIYSIQSKIIILVAVCILIMLLLNVLFILPKSRKTIQKATENNMLDIAVFSAQLIDKLAENGGNESLTTELLTAELSEKKIADVNSSYVYVVDGDGVFHYHKKPDKIGTVVFNDNVLALLKKIPTGNYTKSDVFHYTDENGVVKYAAYSVSEKNGWVSVIVANESEIMSEINEVRNISLLVTCILTIILIIGSIIVARSIGGAIKTITAVILANGRLDFSVGEDLSKLEGRRDETSAMAKAVGNMESALKSMVNRIKNTSEQLTEHEDKLKQITANINSANADNSATSEQLAANMQETAATSTVISGHTEDIRNNAIGIVDRSKEGVTLANEITEKAEGLYSDTLKASQRTEKMYSEISLEGKDALEKSKSVEKINSLATAIQNVANQTNLLALNAAIEAARAGEAGKGFAVVATEISELASQSSETVKNIMIIVDEVKQAVKSMSGCLETTLEYLEKNVISDYKTFLEMSEQYKSDAEGFSDSMSYINNMITNLSSSTDKIAEQISNISHTVEEAANAVTALAEKTTDVASLSSDVLDVVSETGVCADELKEIKNSFTI